MICPHIFLIYCNIFYFHKENLSEGTVPNKHVCSPAWFYTQLVAQTPISTNLALCSVTFGKVARDEC